MDTSNNLVGYVIADDSDSDASATWIQPIQPVLSEYNVSLALDLRANSINEGTQPKDQIDILARTLWGEARGEPEKGIVAVAWVVLNRLNKRPTQFGTSIADVCQKPWQFSCWNAGDSNLPKLLAVTTASASFRQCLEIARSAVTNTLPSDPTKGSCHYYAVSATMPDWAIGHTPAVRIGAHLFYNDIA
jgi:spore germination cell wall hydrolase CwlJ-like protein